MQEENTENSGFDENAKKDDSRLEARITNQHLEALQEVFLKEADRIETRVLLNKEQFIAALDRIVGRGTLDEYGELYDKIDITREGMIDWDKFASHMLLELYEKEDKQRSAQVPNWKALRTLSGPHRETIRRVVHVKSTNKYYTVSKEGVLVTWDSDLFNHKGCKVSTEACRQRDLWVTDFIPLPNANKVAVTFTSKEIGFYDLTASSSKADFACAYMLTGLKHTPFTLDYWYNPENPNQAVLSWGDTGGYINALFLSAANISVFERSGAMQEDEDLNTLNVQLHDLIEGSKYKTSTYMSYHAHTDWTKQVRYLHNMESFISCSTTWADSMAVGWLEKKAKASAKIMFDDPRIERLMKFQISQGINSFDYHERLNLLATGCVNNLVCLWNPYVTSKPSGVLRGHMSPVISVQFNKGRNQVFSFSKDKVLRIWDVQLQVCIQRLAGVFRKGLDVHSTMFYHDDTYRMLLTFNYQLTFLEMKQDIKDRIFSHDKPVVSALYNAENNQVISGDQSGIISVWMLDSGQRIKQIPETHKDAEMTCMALDETGTRVLTGGTDGNIKIFDLNGHPYNTLVCAAGIQVCLGSVVVLKRSILAIGFTKNIICFRPHLFKTHAAEPAEWKGQQEHTDDILAAAFLPPHTLATGAYNGEIVVWNASSESCLRKLNQRVYVPREQPEHNHRDISSAPSAMSSRSRVGTAMSRLRQSRMSRPGSMRGASKNAVYGMQDDDSVFAITKLLFLANRKVANGQTLVSCGANGYVRFWNANNCCLLAEFVAHENASSITMATDTTNDWLVTGDADGMMTVFDISNYAMVDLVANDEIIHDLPRVISKWPAHRDVINTIEMCRRNERTLIISASADCQIGLWDTYGNHIGVFGQAEHWKIEPYQPPVPTEAAAMKSESARGSRFLSMTNERGLAYPDDRAVTDPTAYRLNIWLRTNLGKAYQETRGLKRERKQPSTIPDLPYLQEVQGVPPCGPFTSVEISSLGDYGALHRPDFMINPERYFATQDEINMMKLQRQPLLAESLKAPFDERSLFTKSLLEFEQKMKEQHKLSHQQAQHRASRVDPHAIAEVSKNAQSFPRTSSIAPPSATTTAPRKRSTYQQPPSSAVGLQPRQQRISVSSRSSVTSSKS